MVDGLPEKLKECRLMANLTQKEVANRLKVSTSIISSYESGERTPSLERFLKLSGIYRRSTDYLLGIDTGPQRILIDITELSENGRQTASMVVETLLNAETKSS